MSLGQTTPAAVWFPAGRIVPAAPQHHAECLIRMTDTERFPMASLLSCHSLSPHYPGQCVKGTPLLQDWDNEIRTYGPTCPHLSKLSIWNSVMLVFLLLTFSFTSLWHSNAEGLTWVISHSVRPSRLIRTEGEDLFRQAIGRMLTTVFRTERAKKRRLKMWSLVSSV